MKHLSTPLCNKLFSEYTIERRLSITEEQFQLLLSFYPAISIIIVDGTIDMEEWMYVEKLASHLGFSFLNELKAEEVKEITKTFYTELSHLVTHRIYWHDKFMNALCEYLEFNPDDKKSVIESVYLFADASNGIVKVEQQTIDEYKKFLKINS